MTRSKEFDPQEALGVALECFNRRGYAGSSISMLTREMGMGRASIYATYGDKRSLYMAALENYADAIVAYVVERLEKAEHPLDEIRGLLRYVTETATRTEAPHGCFLVNSTTELASTDREIRALVAGSFSRLEEAYYGALLRAQRDGGLSPKKDARALARFLVAMMQALRVMGKANPDPAVAADVVETALACLD